MKILSVVMVVVGLVWIFQGLGILGGSFMTGEREWLYIGIALAIAGALLFARPRRRGRPD